MLTTEKPIFDNDFFGSITDGDEEFKDTLIKIFISSTENQIIEIKKVVDSAKYNQNNWYSALHSLKGSCSSVGAIKLTSFITDKQNMSEELNREDKIEAYEEMHKLLEEVKSEILKI
ncbi:MAG: HPt (histidine-containing phosphotransfer) domain-containing protein [Rickettsiales bacterium]|jgi:HPt (histidine-containing phosphotransfer) domain-containing protein